MALSDPGAVSGPDPMALDRAGMTSVPVDELRCVLGTLERVYGNAVGVAEEGLVPFDALDLRDPIATLRGYAGRASR